LRFAGILVPEIAPAFSAWGATLPDIGIRVEKSLEAYVPPLPGVTPIGISEMIMKGVAEMLKIKIKGASEIEGIRSLLCAHAASSLDSAWKELRGYIEEEFKKAGLSGETRLRPAVRMLYAGMLDDIEVEAPTSEASEELVYKLCESFDSLFERIYASAARSREFGYTITRAILTGYIALPKPKLLEERGNADRA
jgi:N-methylhydantoinase A/oxoprolinase/acetone carboxylase beta subunit